MVKEGRMVNLPDAFEDVHAVPFLAADLAAYAPDAGTSLEGHRHDRVVPKGHGRRKDPPAGRGDGRALQNGGGQRLGLAV